MVFRSLQVFFTRFPKLSYEVLYHTTIVIDEIIREFCVIILIEKKMPPLIPPSMSKHDVKWCQIASAYNIAFLSYIRSRV